MKNLIIATLLSVSLATTAFAAPISGNSATTNFKSDFKGATNVSWKTTADFVKATFVMNNERREAFYDLEGNIIATSKAVSFAELSENVKTVLSEKYGNYTIRELVQMEVTDTKAMYISLEYDKETLILKVDNWGVVTKWAKSKK